MSKCGLFWLLCATAFDLPRNEGIPALVVASAAKVELGVLSSYHGAASLCSWLMDESYGVEIRATVSSLSEDAMCATTIVSHCSFVLTSNQAPSSSRSMRRRVCERFICHVCVGHCGQTTKSLQCNGTFPRVLRLCGSSLACASMG